MGVLVLGIDGLGSEGLKKLSEMGYLRSVDFIARRYFRATAKTCFPPQTVPAWISIFTGVNPGKHGLFSFFSTSRGRVRIHTSLDVRFPYVFEILSMLRRSVVLFNVPLSYPFRLLYGVGVPDWLAGNGRIVVRHEKKNIIYDIVKESRPISPALKSVLGWQKFADILEHELEIRRWVIEGLLELGYLENYFIVISDLDWLMHSFYHVIVKGNIPKYVEKVLRKISSLIDSIIKRACKRNMDIIIISDHGFKVYNKIVFVNTILKKLGLARGFTIRRVASRRKSRGGLKTLKIRRKSSSEKVLEKMFWFFQKVPIPHNIHRRIYRMVMRSNIRLFVDPDLSPVFSLLNIPAFFIGVNRRIRNKEAYVRYTVKMLSRIRDKHGRRLFSLVATRENIYWGPYVRRAPHICIFGSIRARYLTSAILMAVPIIHKTTNYHDFDSIFIAKSEGIVRGHVGGRSIYDVVPTIYALLDIPIQKGLDGQNIVNKEVRYADHTMRWKIASRIFIKTLKKIS